ncbi:MAG: DivIVA domain-containing protein [Actinomycetia bacterium]|nr:DivIVA domain-containing protein [Actinomycetes bacterium]
MPISSGDIQKKEFHIAFKGYKPEEVDKFLDMISIEFDRMAKKNEELQESIDKLKYERTNESDEMKQVLQDALVSAHKVAEDIKQKAKAEAENIYNQRKVEAEDKLKELELKKQNIEQGMLRVKEKYLNLKKYLQDALQNIEGFEEKSENQSPPEPMQEEVVSETESQEQTIDDEKNLQQDNMQDQEKSEGSQNSQPGQEEKEEEPEKEDHDEAEQEEEEEDDEDEDFNIGKKGKGLDIANPDIIDDFFKTDE